MIIDYEINKNIAIIEKRIKEDFDDPIVNFGYNMNEFMKQYKKIIWDIMILLRKFYEESGNIGDWKRDFDQKKWPEDFYKKQNTNKERSDDDDFYPEDTFPSELPNISDFIIGDGICYQTVPIIIDAFVPFFKRTILEYKECNVGQLQLFVDYIKLNLSIFKRKKYQEECRGFLREFVKVLEKFNYDFREQYLNLCIIDLKHYKMFSDRSFYRFESIDSRIIVDPFTGKVIKTLRGL